MSRFSWHIFGGGAAHLSDAMLTSVLSGELPDRKLLQRQKHLQRCWRCRARYAQLDHAALGFVDYHNLLTESEVANSPKWRNALRLRIEEIERKTSSHGTFGNLRKPFQFAAPGVVRGATMAAVLLIVVATAALWQQHVPTVSASEILRRASLAQESSGRSIAEPLVYQKLHVRRRSSAGSQETAITMELWTDVAHARFRTSAGDWSQVSNSERAIENNPRIEQARAGHIKSADVPALLTELRQTYEANHLNWNSPLSATTFVAWRGAATPLNEKVQRLTLSGGETAYNIQAIEPALSSGAISEARLVVRESDWHPVSEYLKVETDSGKREYEISELEYRLTPLNELAATIFPVPAAAPAPSVTPALPLRPVFVNHADLNAVEVEVRVALHAMGADLGEQIEIGLSGHGQVAVDAITETEQHKQELLTALQAIPNVTTHIETIDDLKKANRLPNALAAAASELEMSRGETAVQELPLQSELEQYFASVRHPAGPEGETAKSSATVEDVQAFTSQVLTLSDKALSEAWALRKLSRRYTPEQTANLSADSKLKLEGLFRDHIRHLEQSTTNLQAMLSPVLVSVGKATTGTGRQDLGSLDAEWPVLTLNLFDTVEVIDRLNSSLFAGAGLPYTTDTGDTQKIKLKTPGECAQDLLTAFSQLQAELAHLKLQVESQFL